jgi:gluconokinase
VEGDELHPKSNVDKMSRGIPLTDEDREPWLELIRSTAEGKVAESLDGVVITCSALKKYYRDILRGRIKPSSSEKHVLDPSEGTKEGTLATFFVWIDGSRGLLEERIEKRQGHFFKASMLESQLKTLESPQGEEGVIVVPLEADTVEQVRIAVEEMKDRHEL